MFGVEQLLHGLGILVVVAPAIMTLVLGGASLIGRPLSERTIARVGHACIATSLTAILAVLAIVAGLLNAPALKIHKFEDWVSPKAAPLTVAADFQCTQVP